MDQFECTIQRLDLTGDYIAKDRFIWLVQINRRSVRFKYSVNAASIRDVSNNFVFVLFVRRFSSSWFLKALYQDGNKFCGRQSARSTMLLLCQTAFRLFSQLCLFYAKKRFRERAAELLSLIVKVVAK